MNLYASTNTVQAYINEKLTELQSKLDKSTFIMGEILTQLSRTLIDKSDKESDNTINKHDMFDSYIKRKLNPPK